MDGRIKSIIATEINLWSMMCRAENLEIKLSQQRVNRAKLEEGVLI